MSANAFKTEKIDLSVERVMRSEFWSPRRELARPAEVIDLARWRTKRSSG